ncbi:MAG: Ig-like domain-containing protein [Planctomycetota bacterium]
MSEKLKQFRPSRFFRSSRSQVRRKRDLRSRYRRSQKVETLEKRFVLTGYFVDFDVLESTDYTHSEFLVRFSDDVDVRSLDNFGEFGPFSKTPVLTAPLGEGFRSDDQLYEIPVMPGQSVEQLVNYYNGLDIVDFAEPNYRMESAAVPNDPFYSVLWGMRDIGAETAWDTRTSSESIIVGVIDSGVQYDHPDLVENIWTNEDEIPNNNIDDDGNGYVDDFFGYDFDNDDSDPMDDNGHGTHVAGTIGARGDNGIGLTGVGWNASLMSLKVIGTGSNADVARAIDYATENGAKITNNSYGYAGNNVPGSRAISDAIGRAKDAGVLYVVAAGNSRSNIPASDVDGNFNAWPAEYSKIHDNVITVSAIDPDGGFAGYSHWGDESVQIAAPGTQIGSTYTENRYVYLSGTSMAAPHVAGAAALLWAEQPDFTYLEIKDALLSTARPEHLDRVTNGVLDLAAALESITTTNSDNEAPTAVDDSADVNEDGSVLIDVLFNDSDPENDALTVQSFTQPSNGSVSNDNNFLTYTPSANFNGSDSFTYTINDGNGNTASAVVTINVASVNDAPVAVDDSVETNEGESVQINVLSNDTDPDNDTLAVQSFTQPSNGTVANNNNVLTYTPAANFSGLDSFTYTVDDGNGGTDSAVVTIDVAAQNDSPVAVNDSVETTEDVPIQINVLSNDTDPENDTLTVQSFTQPSNGSVSNSNNVLTYTPAANFNGSDSFSYTINDGNGNTDSAVVTISVSAVNDGPVAVDDEATTDQGEAVDIAVLTNDSDIDGDLLTVTGVSTPTSGVAAINNDGSVTYTPEDGFAGSDSFTYTISDGTSEDTATVNVTVSAGISEIGVSGIAIDVTHVWKTIQLPVTFQNPVVVAGGSTRNEIHQGVVRIQNVTSDSFQIRFQEWDYLDGTHAAENIGYLVVEAGTHILSDGTQIVAGTTSLSNESWRTVSFSSNFSGTPLVLGQVMTNNDPAAVVERIRNVRSDRFEIQFNEEEAANGIHASETVGYIAIDRGAATSGEVSLNAVVTGDTVKHGATTVSFGSIGGSANPVILSDMQKRDGSDAANLRHRSHTSTSVTLFVEEEASRDRELRHTTEVAGVLALESGILVSGNPLQAAGIAGDRIGTLATQVAINQLTDDAIAYWRDQGFNTIPLESVDFQITNLRNSAIGMQFGDSIFIDVDAAGHGWYVDPDPSTTESFAGMDLYSTIVHEMGHVLGLSDLYDASQSADVMYGYLANGQRSTGPDVDSIDQFFQQQDEGRFGIR